MLNDIRKHVLIFQTFLLTKFCEEFRGGRPHGDKKLIIGSWQNRLCLPVMTFHIPMQLEWFNLQNTVITAHTSVATFVLRVGRLRKLCKEPPNLIITTTTKPNLYVPSPFPISYPNSMKIRPSVLHISPDTLISKNNSRFPHRYTILWQRQDNSTTDWKLNCSVRPTG